MDKNEALRLAWDALETLMIERGSIYDQAITAIKEALAQPEPNYKKALEVWLDKTEWVQETVKPHELGMHRADVLKQRIQETLAQPEKDGECKHCTDGCPACDARKLPEQKPIAWYDPTNGAVSTDKDSPLFTPLGQVLPLYTQRTWISPTDKEIEAMWEKAMFANYGVGAELSNQPFVHYARAIEDKLKEKNYENED